MIKKEMDAFAAKAGQLCFEHDNINDELYTKYNVNRGLRDINGVGVLTGLTNISLIDAFKVEDGKRIAIDGQLWYRGYNIRSLIDELEENEFGFEKTAYLLLFGEKPDEEKLEEFNKVLASCRTLPSNFTRDVIMKAPTADIMNSMTKSILTLASYDKKINGDIAVNISQCLGIIAVFPMLAVYGYHAYCHYVKNGSMYIHRPSKELSTAENFLRILRPDMKYSALEAKVLDVALMLHMEHGGGNNSTFTTRVVTSSGSDTYSAIAAAMSSLKGSRHGGANIKVMEMMQDIRKNVHDVTDEEEIERYLSLMLEGKAFDGKGLIYGMGHAIYSVSDPREKALKEYVGKLAAEKGRDKDIILYENVEKTATSLIAKKRKIYKGVSPNVDFYSGFVYDMLGIPVELYTPLFAIARVVGWSAHRIEELICMNKIIRPAYMSVMDKKE
ncbi:MAG: citrate synthase [Firmicutes bacterium]|nr:citrate synthase [Bacillota bacterium]